MIAELIKKLFDNLQIPATDFNLGFVTGVGLVVAILIVLLVVKIILKIVFRQKKCSGITVIEDDGELFVSKNAVNSMIMAVEKDFPLITINKLFLYRRGPKHILRLQVHFKEDGSGLPTQSSRLKGAIRTVMQQSFGIDSIKKIILDVKDATPEQDNSSLQTAAKSDTALLDNDESEKKAVAVLTE